MRKLKIGYWPLSETLTSAGDRRRLIFWARARGHSVVTNTEQKVDVIVASENSDFNSPYFSQKFTPVIFDLVDAYLSPQNILDDLTRGCAKRIFGQISGEIKPFSQHVRDFCQNSAAVICSSVEQKEIIQIYNKNTHVILDSHDEIPLLDSPLNPTATSEKYRILWEGQPATVTGVKALAPVLYELSRTINLSLDFVTDVDYFKILNKYLQRDTSDLLRRNLGAASTFATLSPWSRGELVDRARKCSAAMIPINLNIPMQRFKPENRLLIMWRLGLPCLTSPSPAYIRVSQQAGVDTVCNSPEDWFEKFQEILNDPGYAHSVVRNGQNYLSENHNRSILLKKWDMVFESVVG